MPVLETRIISGRGLLVVPIDGDDYNKAKVLTLQTTIVRQPKNRYLNFNYNPPKSRYGTLTFLRNGFVIEERSIDYEEQIFQFYPDISAQSLYAIKCAYDGLLQSFVNQNVALGLIVTSVINNISQWTHQDVWFDEIRCVCYADTILQLELSSTPYDLCPEEGNPTPTQPPPPPATTPSVPTGEPATGENAVISPPYDGEDDNGNTVPYPGDTPPEPPEDFDPPYGEEGTLYIVEFTYDRMRPAGVVYDTQFVSFINVRGVIQDYGITDDATAYGSAAPGAYVVGTNPDGTPQNITNTLGFVGFSTSANLRDVSIVPQ